MGVPAMLQSMQQAAWLLTQYQVLLVDSPLKKQKVQAVCSFLAETCSSHVRGVQHASSDTAAVLASNLVLADSPVIIMGALRPFIFMLPSFRALEIPWEGAPLLCT